jgi:4-hydroxy-3-methylbut-2-enyl diphosphate reductase
VEDPDQVAYITQTTLSVDECQGVIEVLRERFPNIQGPPKADICYATTNRQAAVRQLAPAADLVLVVGDPESSNSTRLAELGESMGKPSYLISNTGMIREEWLEGVETVLLTSGASVPENLVQEVIAYLEAKATCTVDERNLIEEDVFFRLPAAIS